MVTTALYKGPATGWFNVLWHHAVCWWTGDIHSHCEMVIKGVCYSSSNRDGGVRAKVIDLTTGRWDFYLVDGDEDEALAWFKLHMGQGYDWLGPCRFVLPLLPHFLRRWFCSEAIAAALGWHKPHRVRPGEFARVGVRVLTPQ